MGTGCRNGRSASSLFAATLVASLLAFAPAPASAQAAPTINGNVNGNCVGGNFFTPGSVTVEIREAPGGTLLFDDTTATDETGNFNLCGPGIGGVDLVPGHEITVSDGATTKVLVLVNLTIDVVDPTTDDVSGTAPPDETVHVNVNDGPGGAGLDVTADSGGAWTADFTGIYDIGGGTQAHAHVNDTDGDNTNVHKGPPTIQGDLNNCVGGNNFASDGSVTVEIREGPGGTLLFDDTIPTNGAGNFNLCGPGIGGVDLVPGNEITVSDGTTTKVLVLVNLIIDVVDPATDDVSGTAPPDETVHVNVNDPPPGGGAGLDVTADSGGAWTADFTGIYDIGGSTFAHAFVTDADGDFTNAHKGPPTINGNLNNCVGGNNFASDGSVTVEIREAPGGTLLFDDTIATNGGGNFNLCGPDLGGVDLVPGNEITVFDGSVTKVLVLVNLTIDAVDPDSDDVSGTAPPDETVHVNVNDPPFGGGGAGLDVTADSGGAWTADFTGIFDIGDETNAHARVDDADGDSTNIDQGPPQVPTFEGSLNGRYAAGCGFVPNGSVTVIVKESPGGSELFNQSVPTDEGSCFNVGFDFDLVPGNFISVDDGSFIKELTLVTLSIDDIDPAANTVAGTAPPDTTFNVDAFTEEGWQGLDATSDGTGAWTVDFDDIGADINPFTHVGANIGDDDGDNTIFDTQFQQGGGNVFNDPNDFQSAIGDHSIIDFEDIDASPVDNTWVGRDPFDGSHYTAQGITFSNPNDYNLYIAPGGLFWNESNSLSVRQFPFDDNADDGNDDDLVVDLDPARVAVGFTLVDNGSHDEFIQYFDAENNLIDQVNFPGNFTDFRAFIGKVSPDQPIAKIKIVELAFDGDDVDYDDFILVDELAPPPLPGFEGNLAFGNVSGCEFTPNASVDVTIKDEPGGAVLFTDSPPTDGEGCFDTGYEVDLVPGMYISVVDGDVTKELTLVTLSIDDIDPAANTVSGMAPPDTTFNVDAFTDDWHGLDATSDGTGAWTVDFDDIGVDITPSTHVGANVVDEDGDGTATDRTLFGGGFEGDLSRNAVEGGGFTPDSTVTLEVFDSPGGALLSSETQSTDPEGNFFAVFDSPCVDLVPGMHIVVADDATGFTKELTLTDMTWDVLDPDTDTAAGTAPPNEFLEVGGFSEDTNQQVQADGDGNWFVDFGAVGVDITPDMLKGEQAAYIGDGDGDNTRTDFVYPYFTASLTDDTIDGREFAPCESVTVEVYDSPGGDLLSSDSASVHARGDFEPVDPGVDLVDGMHVVVADGVVTKELTLDFLTIDYFSSEADSSFGTADPGATVLAGWGFTDPESGGGFGDGVTVTADGNGDWSADFDCCPPDGSEGFAFIEDADGDVTQVRFVPATESIPNLSDDVNALVSGGQLSSKNAKPLLSKLSAALEQANAGNEGPAINQLKAFVSQVKTYVKGGKLSAAAGQALIDAANAIITGLGG
jgi:hypothetical protein